MGKIKELYMDLINSGITPDGLSVDEAVRILKQKDNEEGEQYSRLQSGKQEDSGETRIL
jgi:hypothetical protein